MNEKRDKKEGSAEHDKPAAEIADKSDENMTLVMELGNPESKNADSEYKEGRTYKSLILGSQIVMAIVTVVGVVIAVCTLKDIDKNVTDSHTQAVAAATQAQTALIDAQTAQQQLELSERPWLKVDANIHAPLDFTKNQVCVVITWNISNVGHSPAQRVEVKMGIGEELRQNPIQVQKEVCDTIYPFGQTTVFPDDPVPTPIEMYPCLEGKELVETKKLKHTLLFVSGCVAYLFGNRVYKTPFMYSIGRAKRGTKGVLPFASKEIVSGWVDPKGVVKDAALIASPFPSVPLE
jgi:hypothetical protein